MSESPKVPKKIKAPWILGGFVLLLLTVLILLQSSNLWKNFTIESANDTLLLYALSSLNFFALIIFGFILLRNLTKLARERRALQLGAKIKTRLWLYFFAVSILPIVAMAVFSYLFMNRALERWFTSIPETAIREARKVQDQTIKSQAEKLSQTADMLAVSLDRRDFTNDDLKKIAAAGNLTHIEILSKTNRTIAFYEKTISAEQKTEINELLELVRGGRTDEPVLLDSRGFDAAIASFADGRKLVIVPDLYAAENVSQMVDSSLTEFEDLKRKQVTVRQIGLSTLGVLTFLLIFASSWTALYIARGLTVPIKALAEGADRIRQGNFGHRVEVFAEDELALLVESFNQMSATLEENSAELLERRRYIETVLQSLPTGVISFDSANRVTTINKSAVQILRLEDANFDGFELEKLVNEENRIVLERLLNRAKRIGQASEQTVLQRENTNGGADVSANLPVALTATALPRNFGESSGVVLVIEDLTELITAQRASAWQEVARRMAHEIKNPLTPIQLSAERIAKRCAAEALRRGEGEKGGRGEGESLSGDLVKSEAQTAKVIKEGTETILREVSSLKSMVDEFSRFARLPNVKLESGNLNEIVRQAAALYEDRGAAIELNLGENMPNALVDEEQLKRVFVNLVENSIEAFDAAQSDKRITAKTFYDRARDLIVAEISDNGNGIPPSDFQKLFQPYFSTKGRGTGLGLAIVQRIVSEHRGRIKAVNNTPRGAKFIVELPVIG
ncbi:MAG: HAMP domain-containing protein [Acidobacteria bacterium]|nr:HAMP domain-containing protein [Acidobacteriota bacterium]